MYDSRHLWIVNKGGLDSKTTSITTCSLYVKVAATVGSVFSFSYGWEL